MGPRNAVRGIQNIFGSLSKQESVGNGCCGRRKGPSNNIFSTEFEDAARVKSYSVNIFKQAKADKDS